MKMDSLSTHVSSGGIRAAVKAAYAQKHQDLLSVHQWALYEMRVPTVLFDLILQYICPSWDRHSMDLKLEELHCFVTKYPGIGVDDFKDDFKEEDGED